MSTETERRVGNLLDSSRGTTSSDDSGLVSSRGATTPLSDAKRTDSVPTIETDSAKEKLSAELKKKQENLKVPILIIRCYNITFINIHVSQCFRLL